MKLFYKRRGKAAFCFEDSPNTAVIICCHVLSGQEPILYVTYDGDDGMWQFLCSKSHTTDEARIVGLQEVLDLDPSIGFLSQMPRGFYAARKGKNDSWIIEEKMQSISEADL